MNYFAQFAPPASLCSSKRFIGPIIYNILEIVHVFMSPGYNDPLHNFNS